MIYNLIKMEMVYATGTQIIQILNDAVEEQD